MNLYRLRARRKQRPDDADAAADERFQQCVGDLMGLGEHDAAFLPPLTQCGWMESGELAGGLVYCLACSPQQPTSGHTPVYTESYFATKPCLCCGRRLDSPSV